MQVIYSDIESQIVLRLQPMTNGGGVDVLILPEVENEFQRPFSAGRVTVAYKSSDFPAIKSTHEIVQDELLHFEVVVQARKLRGNNGVHAMVEAIKRLLVGFRPTDCSKMYLVKNGFTSRDPESSVWTYSMIFETRYLLVEDVDEETGSLLEKIEFIYNGEDNEVIPSPLCAPCTIFDSLGNTVAVVNSGAFKTLDDTPVQVIDINGDEVGTGAVPSVTGGVIQIDGTITTCPAPPPCAPATFELNGIEVGTAASGGELNVDVKNTSNTQVGSLVSGEFIVPDATANVSVNGVASVSEPIPSGVSETIPLTVVNTTASQVGTIVGSTVTAPDATVQLTTPSGTLQQITAPSGDTVSQQLRIIGRMPYKTGVTGASTPPAAGVDGFTQRGRNFFTLDYLNAWGNTNRFTWKDGTQVYPNGVTAEGNGYVVDNATWDRNGKVLLIAYVTTPRNYADQATTALTTTIDGFNDWFMINSEELSELATANLVVLKQLNYPPFNIAIGTPIVTSTENPANNTQCVVLTGSGTEGVASKTNTRNTFFVRVATLTIDSLGNVTIS